MEQQKNTPTPQAEALLQRFRDRYLPSEEFLPGIDYLTTEEIYEQLKASCFALGFDTDYLYDWLHKAGYHQETISEVKLVWLLKVGD